MLESSCMINLIKQFIPASIISFYHQSLAVLANWYYGRPSEKLIVIGVTGTNGKTTTVSLIAKILEEAGFKVGSASTAIFKIASDERLNDQKMTMLGRFALQKMLSAMVRAGCNYAVIETSSQGIEQFRHWGIHYDVGIFTNLTPEHIEAHGGFANYKKAKLKLFRHLESLPEKTIAGKKISKVVIVNGDDQYANEFLDFKVAEKIVFSLVKSDSILAKDIFYGQKGVSFLVQDTKFDLKLFGKFNVYNSLAAIATAISQGISLETCQKALEKVDVMPGRLEFIENSRDLTVIVDYAPEPESLRQLFETIKLHQLVSQNNKIVHVFGSCGGGRDKARQPIMGELSAHNSDLQIITNEDPYDDDPKIIIDAVASGAVKAGSVLGDNVFKVLDRREAIRLALSLARPGDLVLLTGKGSEQAICGKNGEKIPWDEREVVREELKK